MRILLASTSYPLDAQDWRGRFIADMVAALGNIPAVDLQLWSPPGQLPPHVGYGATHAEAAWLRELIRQGGIAHLLRKRGPLALPTAWGLLSRLRGAYRRSGADLLHVNWLQNALSLEADARPALITVLGSDFALLRLPGMVGLLRRALRGRRAILAPNAEWMAETLEKHFGDLAEVRPVPFGIASHWFAIARDRRAGVSREWIAVTRLTPDKLGPLFEWGETPFRNGHVLHLFGPHQDARVKIPDWVRYHGPTHPAELRDDWFPRVSGLITLSRHAEGRPQVMLEAMASGLPVIASALPAHLDLIEDGVTGVIVESEPDFLQALDRVAESQCNVAIGESARSWVRTRIGTWDDCAGRYLAAYGDLLERAA